MDTSKIRVSPTNSTCFSWRERQDPETAADSRRQALLPAARDPRRETTTIRPRFKRGTARDRQPVAYSCRGLPVEGESSRHPCRSEPQRIRPRPATMDNGHIEGREVNIERIDNTIPPTSERDGPDRSPKAVRFQSPDQRTNERGPRVKKLWAQRVLRGKARGSRDPPPLPCEEIPIV